MPQNFKLWKWRAQYRRRLFFFSLLQLILIFEWVAVHQMILETESWSDVTSGTGYSLFYRNVPILFYLCHLVIFIVAIFTQLGRHLIHESQGERFCNWTAFSLIVAMIYLLGMPSETLNSSQFNNSRNICFSTLAMLGVGIFQHFGVSEPILSILKLAISILWITLFAVMPLLWSAIISICLIVVGVILLSEMHEWEYRRAFTNQLNAITNSYAGSSSNNSGNSHVSLFVEDTLCMLKAMESSIALQSDLLTKDSLLIESISDEDCDIYSNNNTYNSSSNWRLTSHAATLQINKLLCQSLHYALAHTIGQSSGYNINSCSGAITEFSFSKVCYQVISLYEAVRGFPLTIYVHEPFGEAIVTAPKAMFELIIFLLIHETAHADDRRICSLSCEKAANGGGVGNNWNIIVQTTMLVRHHHHHTGDFLPFRTGGGGSAISMNNSLSNDDHSGDDTNSVTSGSIGGGGGRSSGNLSNNGSNAGGGNSAIAALGKHLQLNEKAFDRNKPMERLADRIVNKYLQSTIYYCDAEYKAGAKIEQKLILLSADRCKVIPPVMPSSSAVGVAGLSPPSSSESVHSSYHEGLNGGGGGGGGSSSSSTASFLSRGKSFFGATSDNGATTVDGGSSSSNNNDTAFQYHWLFIVQRSHDLEGMGEIKDKLKTLKIPQQVMSLLELKDRSAAIASMVQQQQQQRQQQQLQLRRGSNNSAATSYTTAAAAANSSPNSSSNNNNSNPVGYAVAVIDESYLMKLSRDHKEKGLFDTLRTLHHSSTADESDASHVNSGSSSFVNNITSWIVVCDSKQLSSPSDIRYHYDIDAETLSNKASMQELFDCIQMVTSKLTVRTVEPDAIALAAAGINNNIKTTGRVNDIERKFLSPPYADRPSAISIQQQQHTLHGIGSSSNRIQQQQAVRADVAAIKYWLYLVRQFREKIPQQHGDALLLNGLDSRMREIEQLGRIAATAALSVGRNNNSNNNGGGDGEDIDGCDDNKQQSLKVPDYAGKGILAKMSEGQKRAKYVLDIYQPMLIELNKQFEVFDLIEMQKLTAAFAVKSSSLGLSRLSCWCTTLQEIVSITINLLNSSINNNKELSLYYPGIASGCGLGTGASNADSGGGGNSMNYSTTSGFSPNLIAAATTANTGAGSSFTTANTSSLSTAPSNNITTSTANDNDNLSNNNNNASASNSSSPVLARLESFRSVASSSSCNNNRPLSVTSSSPQQQQRDRIGSGGSEQQLLYTGRKGSRSSRNGSTSSNSNGIAATTELQKQRVKLQKLEKDLRNSICDMIRAMEVAVWDAAMR